MTIHQISVFLENRAGQLAEIAAILSDNAIDMRAMSIAESADYGVLRLIVSDPEKAASTLLAKGYILSMTPVLAVSVPDEPGALTHILDVLSKNAISLEYAYAALTTKAEQAYMVFRVADNERAISVLTDAGITVVPQSALF
jgi:hypothetical protein